ncbi:MAG: DUF6504 family protein [Acetobacteraceae bacterium]|nr:DUF6504 family protein [Acetobacteraceae bacterium]
MTRAVETPVQVVAGPEGRPRRFRWRRRWYAVSRVLDEWTDSGCWWEGEGEKRFFRVETAAGSMLELYRDVSTSGWVLYRVYD